MEVLLTLLGRTHRRAALPPAMMLTSRRAGSSLLSASHQSLEAFLSSLARWHPSAGLSLHLDLDLRPEAVASNAWMPSSHCSGSQTPNQEPPPPCPPATRAASCFAWPCVMASDGIVQEKKVREKQHLLLCILFSICGWH